MHVGEANGTSITWDGTQMTHNHMYCSQSVDSIGVDGKRRVLAQEDRLCPWAPETAPSMRKLTPKMFLQVLRQL